VLLGQLVGGQLGVLLVVGIEEVALYLREGILALVLVVVACHGYGVALVVGLPAHLGLEVVVVGLVAVLALLVGAQLAAEFFLQLAHGLDGLRGCLERAYEVLLRHLVHLALHHHDVVFGGAHHDVHVALCHLLLGRVYYVFAVDPAHAHLADGALEGDVGAGHGRRGGESCERVGLVHAVGAEQHHLHVYLAVVVGGEERPEHAVDEPRGEYLVVASLALALGEAPGEAPCSRILLTVVYL